MTTLLISRAPAVADGGAAVMYLVVGMRSVEIVSGEAKVGQWTVQFRTGPHGEDLDVIDGTQFLVNKEFWKTIKSNELKFDERSRIEVTEDGRLLYTGKPIDVGARVTWIETALRWGDWIVAIGNIEGERTIKGPKWFLIWFDPITLKGSHQFVDIFLPPLRIYSK